MRFTHTGAICSRIYLILLPFFLALFLFASITAHTQDSTQRYIDAVNEKATAFNTNVDKYTLRTMDRLIRQEQKMQTKVAKKDTTLARKLFTYSIDSLQKFKSIIQNNTAKVNKFSDGHYYFAYLDTLQQSLAFLNKANGVTGSVTGTLGTLTGTSGPVSELGSKLAVIGQINTYLDQRQAVLRSGLTNWPQLTGNVAAINKEAVYYQAQINEYKNTLKDPEKIERLALNALEKTSAFQKFMQQNSQLAGIFASSASFAPGTPNTTTVNGLSARSAVQQSLQASMPASGSDAMQLVQQQTDNASALVQKLTDKLNGVGGLNTSGGLANPSGLTPSNSPSAAGFTPNGQHTKPFLKRLEYGTDLQFTNSTNYLPATGNFSLSIGYKLDDKSALGAGVAYHLGLGNGWNHIRFSNEGVGLRTYGRQKLKGSIFLQGGVEWNYLQQPDNLQQIKNYKTWQTAALLGLSKTYKVGKKISGNIQLLYDFLYNQHLPNSQPVLFRVGYNL